MELLKSFTYKFKDLKLFINDTTTSFSQLKVGIRELKKKKMLTLYVLMILR